MISLEEYQKLPVYWDARRAVERDVYWAVDRAATWAVFGTVSGDVGRAVRWVVRHAGTGDVYWAVYWAFNGGFQE